MTLGPVSDGSIRLVSGRSANEGFVEIYHDGQWGSICRDRWDFKAGIVACRQLGYANASTVDCCSTAIPRLGPYWFPNLQCSGSESNIKSCPQFSWGNASSSTLCTRDTAYPATVRCLGELAIYSYLKLVSVS